MAELLVKVLPLTVSVPPLVEDAAAGVAGGVAGEGAADHRRRPALVEDAAAVVTGRVAGEGAADHRRSTEVVDAAAVAAGVAGEGAADHRRSTEVVDAATTVAWRPTSDRHARETNGHASIDREDAEIGRPRGAAAGYGQARRPGALDVGQAGGVAQVRQGGVERDRTGDGEVDRVIARGLVDLGDDIPQVPRETQAGARVSQAVDGEGRQQRPVFEAFQLQPPPGVGTPGRGNCDSDREVADHQRTMGSKRDIGIRQT